MTLEQTTIRLRHIRKKLTPEESDALHEIIHSKLVKTHKKSYQSGFNNGMKTMIEKYKRAHGTWQDEGK